MHHPTAIRMRPHSASPRPCAAHSTHHHPPLFARCPKNPTYMKKMCPEACKDKPYDPPTPPANDEARSKKKKKRKKKKKAEDKDEV